MYTCAHAPDVLAALRDAIGNTTDPHQLSALAQTCAAVASVSKSMRALAPDIAVLLARMPALRKPDDCLAFAAPLKSAVQLGSPPLSLAEIGRIYATALLQPISGGEPTAQLVTDYEEITQKRSNKPGAEAVGTAAAVSSSGSSIAMVPTTSIPKARAITA